LKEEDRKSKKQKTDNENIVRIGRRYGFVDKRGEQGPLFVVIYKNFRERRYPEYSEFNMECHPFDFVRQS
jgi:hypothetical protein